MMSLNDFIRMCPEGKVAAVEFRVLPDSGSWMVLGCRFREDGRAECKDMMRDGSQWATTTIEGTSRLSGWVDSDGYWRHTGNRRPGIAAVEAWYADDAA